jgi:hypothetical protein
MLVLEADQLNSEAALVIKSAMRTPVEDDQVLPPATITRRVHVVLKRCVLQLKNKQLMLLLSLRVQQLQSLLVASAKTAVSDDVVTARFIWRTL